MGKGRQCPAKCWDCPQNMIARNKQTNIKIKKDNTRIDRWTNKQTRKDKDKCSLNRAQASVLLVPVPSLVDADDSVGKGIQHKTFKTYQLDQKKR